MTRTILYFLAGAFVCWLPLAALCDVKWKQDRKDEARSIWRHDGLICAAATGPICLVPTTLSLVLALWSQSRSPSEQLMAVMGGMMLRMGVVLAVGLLVFLQVPHESGEGLMFKRPEREYAYWGSLLVFYLFTLGWETFLVTRNKRDESPAKATGGAGN